MALDPSDMELYQSLLISDVKIKIDTFCINNKLIISSDPPGSTMWGFVFYPTITLSTQGNGTNTQYALSILIE